MTNHTGHGHPATPAARATCRKFMADHDGMDQVTYRVSVREAELDDTFETEENSDLIDNYIMARDEMKALPILMTRRNPIHKAAWDAMIVAARALRNAGLDPKDYED